MEKVQNDFTVSQLSFVRDTIESMTKFNQIEVMKLLQKEGVELNENKYGIHINLTELPNETIYILDKFIQYIEEQESSLNQVEKQKESFKNTFFLKASHSNTKSLNIEQI
jgi:hypothetical protein